MPIIRNRVAAVLVAAMLLTSTIIDWDNGGCDATPTHRGTVATQR